jgi:hypothetical protein
MPRHFHKMMSPQFFNHGVRHSDGKESMMEKKIENFLKNLLMFPYVSIKRFVSKIRSYF